MSEEYTSEIIENTRRQMKNIGYESVKEGMLDSAMLTQSWFGLEDLKEIMPENEYQELLKLIETRERETFSRDEYPDISQEKLEKVIQEEIKRTKFIITDDGENKHKIEEFFAIDEEKITKPIDVKDIDGAQLAKTIAEVMQRHLDYRAFHANKYYSAEEIERALKVDIDRLKRQEIVFQQDKGDVQKEENEVVSEDEIRKQKESATEAPHHWYGIIDKAVEYLQECKSKGENVYVNFNGHKLYSCDVTLDSAYLEVVGVTKEEDDAIDAEYAKAKTKEEKKAVIEKWKNMKKAHKEAGDKKENPTVLESAVEATEGEVKVSSIKEQVEGVKEENTIEEIKKTDRTEMSE